MKHLQVTERGMTLPTKYQFITKILQPKGNNLHQVRNGEGKEFLVSMPRKFRKILYVRRGDFVIVDPIEEGQKVKGEIVRILNQESIQYFLQEQIWPEAFYEDIKEIARQMEKKAGNTGYEMDLPPMSDEEEESDDEFVTCNPNRYTRFEQSTNDEDESESEDEDEDEESESEESCEDED